MIWLKFQIQFICRNVYFIKNFLYPMWKSYLTKDDMIIWFALSILFVKGPKGRTRLKPILFVIIFEKQNIFFLIKALWMAARDTLISSASHKYVTHTYYSVLREYIVYMMLKRWLFYDYVLWRVSHAVIENYYENTHFLRRIYRMRTIFISYT